MKAPGARARHWQAVYRNKRIDDVSWHRPHLETSLELIGATGVRHGARILDVGGGGSTLVDDLLERGFRNIAVLDISAEALAVARRRVGERTSVQWIEADITRCELEPGSVDIWHDRAMLHFLVDESELAAYVQQLRAAVADRGHAILSTFAPGGPPECSALPVRRYDADGLRLLVGDDFVLRRAASELHRTPSGRQQPFTCCWFSRRPATGHKIDD